MGPDLSLNTENYMTGQTINSPTPEWAKGSSLLLTDTFASFQEDLMAGLGSKIGEQIADNPEHLATLTGATVRNMELQIENQGKQLDIQNKLLSEAAKNSQHDREMKENVMWVNTIGKGLDLIVKTSFAAAAENRALALQNFTMRRTREWQNHMVNMHNRQADQAEVQLEAQVALQSEAIAAKKQVALAEIAERGKTQRNGQNKVAMRMRVRSQGVPQRQLLV